ncbi:SET domain-containing protein 5 [Fusarium oxysporum f. sp. cubense]|uniref:SET domain-containing protein 5 n=1 Tax=Fusarium oxysporum f. sp. cubense TaxID=61366 RepID=A0A559KL60_FUSOC|nr:SET domain-containing protein 5 [Fusarium oxysporum f. sp. cubense]
MSSLANNEMVALREVPGKGKGLIATHRILKGTRILSEEPIIRIPEDTPDSPALRASLRRQVDELTSDQRRAFLSMCNVYPGEADSQYLGIFRTNALPIESGSGIFLAACRINHACDNNAQKAWNEGIKRHTVHALRDIDKGEEITITYVGILNNRRTRPEALRKKFKFTCSCNLCSLPPHLSAESDRRLDEILRLDARIGRDGLVGILSDPKRVLGYVDQQVRLYNEQTLDDVGLPRAFFDAAQITVAHGDLARARVFTERAAAGWLVLEGDDSPRVLNAKQLAQDPSSHDTYGYSTAWRTAVDDVPQGLDSNEFENWIWKREKENEPEQLGILRNQVMFPSFLQLPDETDVEDDFFKSRDGVNCRPWRHWCFLAEIVDFATIVRLHMEVKDVAGMIIPLSFYTDRRGSEIDLSQLCKGYTIAVLYARQHAFAFSEPGIRHEDPTLFKIFPLSLDNLLALSDRVQRFSMEANGMRICHGCEKQATSLKRCAKCSLFWYCNGVCQKAGWSEKDHKVDCKLLCDGDLKGLFSLNWDDFQDFARFPLARSVH